MISIDDDEGIAVRDGIDERLRVERDSAGIKEARKREAKLGNGRQGTRSTATRPSSSNLAICRTKEWNSPSLVKIRVGRSVGRQDKTRSNSSWVLGAKTMVAGSGKPR